VNICCIAKEAKGCEKLGVLYMEFSVAATATSVDFLPDTLTFLVRARGCHLLSAWVSERK
jgi:hypothetical protein